jgi:hypothetical protein
MAVRRMLLVMAVSLALAAAIGQQQAPAQQSAAESALEPRSTEPAPAQTAVRKEVEAWDEARRRKRHERSETDSHPATATPYPRRIQMGALTYAPQGAKEGSGFGLELYQVRRDRRLRGGAFWFAGAIAPEPDVKAPIPHSDFTRRGYDSRMGLLYLFGRDDGRVAAIGGVGLALVQVQYIDTSNVTGWTWDGGTHTVLGFQGQAGVLAHLGGRTALRLGYDSQFGGFAGLAFGQ